jgi:hypothetical protein
VRLEFVSRSCPYSWWLLRSSALSAGPPDSTSLPAITAKRWPDGPTGIRKDSKCSLPTLSSRPRVPWGAAQHRAVRQAMHEYVNAPPEGRRGPGYTCVPFHNQ